MWLGKKVIIWGKTINNATVRISIATKGIMPLKISSRGISGATLRTM
jgi:hypothetical protein